MTGESPEAIAEMNEVVDLLIDNSSLRRLAENPLLLTMLLVVKHGAGRLPPDRVSLYSRAVEVLLDTWNIKGHEPLNLKESIPQLACVAFELLKSGKQTATERELLKLLENARDRVPHIRRYAKDSPYDFLKRVELRSSLLLEAGHQIEGGSTVPFYQFRHLTFQEYLAAVAVAEAHYIGYRTDDTILTPLSKTLISDEWKEVVPMAAVLARKQAEPLITELIHQAQAIRARLESGEKLKPSQSDLFEPKLPPPVSRLAQCLVEEAEAAPETITQALQLIAFFARGCDSEDDWRALARGPYGPELLHHCWILFSKHEKSRTAQNTCQTIAALAWGKDVVQNGQLDRQLQQLLSSKSDEEVARGLFIITGWAAPHYRYQRSRVANPPRMPSILIEEIEKHFLNDSPAVVAAALWAWILVLYQFEVEGQPTARGLDQILNFWLRSKNGLLVDASATALWTQLGLEREKWTPVLQALDIQEIKSIVCKKGEENQEFSIGACLVVAFHSKSVWSDTELLVRLKRFGKRGRYRRPESRIDPVAAMLRQLRSKTARKPKKPTRRKVRR